MGIALDERVETEFSNLDIERQLGELIDEYGKVPADKRSQRKAFRLLKEIRSYGDSEEFQNAGTRLKFAIYASHENFIHYQVRRFLKYRGIQMNRRESIYEELVRAGENGLLNAIDRYDPDMITKIDRFGKKFGKPVEFITYGGNAIYSEIRSAWKYGISHPITTLHRSKRSYLSEQIPDKKYPSPIAESEKNDFDETLRQLLESSISSRQLEILRARFGFDDEKPKTFDEIGKNLGMHRANVFLTLKRVLDRLSHNPQLIELYETLD